jgi:hypothetical protein
VLAGTGRYAQSDDVQVLPRSGLDGRIGRVVVVRPPRHEASRPQADSSSNTPQAAPVRYLGCVPELAAVAVDLFAEVAEGVKLNCGRVPVPQ